MRQLGEGMQGMSRGFSLVERVATLDVATISRAHASPEITQHHDCHTAANGGDVGHRMRVPGYRCRGFTLVELMVTVAVMAILAVVALPSLRGLVNSNRLRAGANETIAVLQAARMEAIRSNRRVVACMSAAPNAATPTCATAGASGWIVFQDADRNGQYGASERLIRRTTVTGNVQLLASTAFATGITFHSDGMARDVGGSLLNAVVAVCLPTTEPQENESDVSISAGSRIRVLRKKAAGKCVAPGDSP
jgi:type IV fimbrial biogenesis protein FimT